jgi:glycosyltransferase involved in cell wall biosynthesis
MARPRKGRDDGLSEMLRCRLRPAEYLGIRQSAEKANMSVSDYKGPAAKMRMAQSTESQAQARGIKEGRDKELFRKEQRSKQRQELDETKRELTAPTTPPRSPSIGQRLAKARRAPDKQHDQSAANETRKQPADTSQGKEPAREGSTLAEKFRKAQERGVGAKTTRDQFKDNADDISRDTGRERIKKPPKFSVLIANYNNAHLIQQALDSIKRQTIQDFEVIVVDDGSTDNSRSIVEMAAASFDGKLRYIYQSNKGVASARNAAIAVSAGKYITFLDPDDYWHDERLQVHAAILDKHENVGVCCSDFDRLHEDGHVERHFSKWVTFPRFPFEQPISRDDAFRWLLLVNFVGTNGATIRRTCVQTVGLFNEEYKQAEDYDYWLRCAMNTEFYVLRRVLHTYRIHQGGLSKNFLENCEYSQRAVQECAKAYDGFIKSHRLEDAVRNSISRRWYEIGDLNFEGGHTRRAFGSYVTGLRSEISFPNLLRFMSVTIRKTIRLSTLGYLSRKRFSRRSSLSPSRPPSV